MILVKASFTAYPSGIKDFERYDVFLFVTRSLELVGTRARPFDLKVSLTLLPPASVFLMAGCWSHGHTNMVAQRSLR